MIPPISQSGASSIKSKYIHYVVRMLSHRGRRLVGSVDPAAPAEMLLAYGCKGPGARRVASAPIMTVRDWVWVLSPKSPLDLAESTEAPCMLHLLT